MYGPVIVEACAWRGCVVFRCVSGMVGRRWACELHAYRYWWRGITRGPGDERVEGGWLSGGVRTRERARRNHEYTLDRDYHASKGFHKEKQESKPDKTQRGTVGKLS